VQVQLASLAGQSCAKKRLALQLAPQGRFAAPGPWSIYQAFSVHYFLELAQFVGDLASQDAQGSGLAAVDGLGGCNSRLSLHGPWASAQAAVATALG
jgi:hypothetical protein